VLEKADRFGAQIAATTAHFAVAAPGEAIGTDGGAPALLEACRREDREYGDVRRGIRELPLTCGNCRTGVGHFSGTCTHCTPEAALPLAHVLVVGASTPSDRNCFAPGHARFVS
jgi:hypothetical protein